MTNIHSQPTDVKEDNMAQDSKLTKDDLHNEVKAADALQAPSPQPAPWSQQLIVALRLLIAGILLCSVLYPLLVTLVVQALWPATAHGGIIELDGEAIGAELIGQSFNSDIFFHPRPSSKGYDGMNSGSQNLGPLNELLTERVAERLQDLQERGIDPARVPAAWVTESGSSLDPHIMPAAARLQAPRVSRASGLSPSELEELIAIHTEGKLLGIFGWERVNVLLLNMDVQARIGEQP